MTSHTNGEMKHMPSLDFREKGWTIVWKGWSRFRM